MKAKIINVLNKVFSGKVLTLILYSSITFWVILHHEPWRDEAQAWLIARDLPLWRIFLQMRYEGTPMLWHLLITPFAKIGLPYFSLQILHWLIAGVAIFILLNRSPFAWLTKIGFVFSYYLFWEYVIVARSYSLTVLLLFLIASTYKERHKQKIKYALMITLLINTNAHIFALAITLVFLFGMEISKCNKFSPKIMTTLAIMGTGISFAVLQLRPPPDSPYHAPKALDFSLIQDVLVNAFFPYRSSPLAWLSILLIVVSLMAASYRSPQRNLAVVLIVSYSWLTYIFLFKHSGGYRHYGLIFIFLVFYLWIINEYPVPKKEDKHVLPASISKDKNQVLCTLKKQWKKCLLTPNNQKTWYKISVYLLTLTSLISSLSAFNHHALDLKYDFSGAKDMAHFLREHPSLMSRTIVANPSPQAIGVLPYLPKLRFWYADMQKYGTFITWNNQRERSKNIDFAEVLRRTQDNGFYSKELLFLLITPLEAEYLESYELLYESTGGQWGYGFDEKFYLYQPKTGF